jgi:hypothetical protein
LLSLHHFGFCRSTYLNSFIFDFRTRGGRTVGLNARDRVFQGRSDFAGNSGGGVTGFDFSLGLFCLGLLERDTSAPFGPVAGVSLGAPGAGNAACALGELLGPAARLQAL